MLSVRHYHKSFFLTCNSLLTATSMCIPSLLLVWPTTHSKTAWQQDKNINEYLILKYKLWALISTILNLPVGTHYLVMTLILYVGIRISNKWGVGWSCALSSVVEFLLSISEPCFSFPVLQRGERTEERGERREWRGELGRTTVAE